MIFLFIKRVFYFISFISILFSCKNKTIEKNETKLLKYVIEDNLGKELIIPESLSIYKPFNNYVKDSSQISNSEFKIYSHIDASCSTCVDNIELWNVFSESIEENNKISVSVILIFTSKDEFELIKYLIDTNKIKTFPYPFFLDSNKEYTQLNKFMSESSHFETVLTNKYNNILLFGNPIHSREIKNMYISKLKKEKDIN